MVEMFCVCLCFLGWFRRFFVVIGYKDAIFAKEIDLYVVDLWPSFT